MTSRFPIQSLSLSAAIADRLRQKILQGHWPSGSTLDDGEIATQLGVSRAPVREALKQLCHEGLLTARPHQGMAVTTLNTTQIQEAHALLHLLTQHFAQQAAIPNGLGQRMMQMAQDQLQLAQINSLPQK